jgi:hypothetical protein
MQPLVPSRDQFEVLRGIAQAGFHYSATKQLCSDAGWEIVSDEPRIGFLQYFLWLGPGLDDRRLLSIGTPEVQGGPYIYLPLYYFPEEEGENPEEHDRTPFDEAYRCLSDGVGVILGPALREGTYEYPVRSGWPYSFRAWRTKEAQVILLQDEHDIQFGMDVSLWLFSVKPEVSIPLPF